MQDKIIWQMLESLRSTPLSQFDSFKLCLAILTWAKLSRSKALPEELLFNARTLDDAASMRKVFAMLGEDSGEDIRIPNNVRPAFELALRLNEAGVLQHFEPADAICSIDARYSMDGALPPEVANLVVGLAGIRPEDSVYTPWDSGGQLSARAARNAASVYLETPTKSAIPGFVSMLLEKSFSLHVADPIQNPSAVEEGKPRKFDVAISFPPFGLKYDAEVVQRDWFGRFPERTTSGSVLAIRHILSQARRRVVVAVPNTVLFSVGAELALREDLVERGIIEAVIAMPSGLLSSSRISFAILILDPSGGHDQIRFVNADGPRFCEAVSKAKCRLVNLDSLLQLPFDPSNSDFARTASADEVMNKGAQLQVNRYVLPESSRRFEGLFEDSEWGLLGDLVDTVRPLLTVTKADEGIEAREIGAADIPPFGYILKPGRTVLIDRQVAGKNKEQFLKPLDIVLIVKGSVGKVGIVTPDVPAPGPGGWVAGQSAIVLRTNRESSIDPRAMAMQLRSPFGQELLTQIVSGAAIPLIQLRELMHLEVLNIDRAHSEQVIEALGRETHLQREIDRLRNEQSNVSSKFWNPTHI
jgi:type I restriction enzyme M protein